MEATEARRAVAAAMSTASELDLAVDDAIVLSDSNRLVIRLTPCDTVAGVTPMTHFASAEQEVELVRRLAQTDSPVAPLEPRVEPRVFVHDGFKIALWAYFEPARSRMLPPAEYAQALAHLHAGLRRIEVTTPHFMDRVAATQRDVASTRRTGRSSLTSKTPPVGLSSTTWLGCPVRSASTIPTLTKIWSASAGGSYSRSSRPTPERQRIGSGVPPRSARGPAVAGARRCRLVERHPYWPGPELDP